MARVCYHVKTPLFTDSFLGVFKSLMRALKARKRSKTCTKGPQTCTKARKCAQKARKPRCLVVNMYNRSCLLCCDMSAKPGDIIFDNNHQCLCMVANESNEPWRNGNVWRSVYVANFGGDMSGMPQDYKLISKCYYSVQYKTAVATFLQAVRALGTHWFVNDIKSGNLNLPQCAKDTLQDVLARDRREERATEMLPTYSLAPAATLRVDLPSPATRPRRLCNPWGSF